MFFDHENHGYMYYRVECSHVRTARYVGLNTSGNAFVESTLLVHDRHDRPFIVDAVWSRLAHNLGGMRLTPT